MIRSNASSASAFERVEHARVDPLVASGSQRRVRHLMLEDRFDVDPRRAGHEPNQDPSETQPIGDTGPMTTKWMHIVIAAGAAPRPPPTQHRPLRARARA